MRIYGTWSLLCLGAPLWVFAQLANAQDTAPTPSPDHAQITAMPAKAAVPAVSEKGKKAEYTGPNNVVLLPATPMLDEEGRQRLDPDGQPMFNAPVRQQRDKKGHPLFDENAKPVFQTATDLGYDEHGKKLHAHKEKEPKMTPVSISRGTFTVDGMIAKAELNYDIPDFKYIYMYVPGIGTLVVSNTPFPGAKEQRDAFDDKTLTVTTADHKLQIGSDKRMLGKNPQPAYVLVDRDFRPPSKYPVVGYGKVLKAPYAWPGGRPNTTLAGAFVEPPPIPVNLQPTLLLSPCPAGQMRKAAPAVLPGQTVQDRPCAAITKGEATMSGTTVKGKDAATPASLASATAPSGATSQK